MFLLYIFDLSLLNDFSYGKLLSFINSLKFINRKFYYLLCFYSVKELIELYPTSFYLWTENQLHTKSISYAINQYISSHKKLKIKFINYIGYPFFSNYYPHLLPTYFELKSKFFASDIFMFTNNQSLYEMKNCLDKLNIKIIYEIASKRFDRYYQNQNKENRNNKKKIVNL